MSGNLSEDLYATSSSRAATIRKRPPRWDPYENMMENNGWEGVTECNQGKKNPQHVNKNCDSGHSRSSYDRNQKLQDCDGEVACCQKEEKPKIWMRFEALAEEEPCEIILILANSTVGLKNLLRQQLSPDLLILIMKVLAKLCKADFEEHKAGILLQVCHVAFLEQIVEHINLIFLENNKKRKENVDYFLDDLVSFMETVINLQTVINLLPARAVNSFQQIFMIADVMKIFEGSEYVPISKDVMTRYKQLKMRYETYFKEQKNKEENKASAAELLPEDDDFCNISLFPTQQDILTDGPDFIRPNIVHGAYDGVDHYLDVQFRLLREDFVSPLRDGIMEYLSMANRRKRLKNSGVRMYPKVYISKPKIINYKLGLVVSFDPDNYLKRVVWETSERFMFGALLLFSRDNFTNIMCATVMERNLEDLRNGMVFVQLSEDMKVSEELSLDKYQYMMAETKVYFEPYYHVLKALQFMRCKAFPMERYIIRAQMSDTPPEYMCAEGGVTLDIEGLRVSVLQEESWPGHSALRLDPSQYSAFRSALTREFVIVQGPPGTGKTFLGLKVTSVLLRNSHIWNKSRNPILVVCYTNHALDQFLEGLIPVTKRIVRVGGQSKSKALEDFNLKVKRRTKRKNMRHLLWKMRDPLQNIRNRMSDITHDINHVQKDLEMISAHRQIISLSSLKEHHVGMSQDHLNCFDAVGSRTRDTLFVEWLEYGLYDDAPEEEVPEGQVQGGSVEMLCHSSKIEPFSPKMENKLMCRTVPLLIPPPITVN